MDIETLAAHITVGAFMYAVFCKVFAFLWPSVKSKIVSVVKEIIDESAGNKE